MITLLLLFAACKTGVLRKQINGAVYDSSNRQPIKGAALISLECDTLSVTDSAGRFVIAAVTEKPIPVPGEEKGALAPNSDKVVISKSGFKRDTIFIYNPSFKTTGSAIEAGIIYLKPLQHD